MEEPTSNITTSDETTEVQQRAASMSLDSPPRLQNNASNSTFTLDEKKFDDGSPPPPQAPLEETQVDITSKLSMAEKTPSKIPSMSSTGSIRKSGTERLSSSKIPSLSVDTTTTITTVPIATTTTAEPGSERRRSRRIRQRSTGDIVSAMASGVGSNSSSTTSSPIKRQNSSDGLDQMNSDVNRKLHFIKEETKTKASRTSITDRLYEDAKRKIKARQEAQMMEKAASSKRAGSPVKALSPTSSNVMDRLYEDAQLKFSIRREEARKEEEEREIRLSPTRRKAKPIDWKTASLDRLYEDSKAKRQKEEEKEKHTKSLPPDMKKVSVLDRLYDDAKHKIEERRRLEEIEKEMQRKLEEQQHQKLVAAAAKKENMDGRPTVLDRLYEDAKVKFTRQAEEEMQKQREAEEAEALQKKKQEALLHQKENTNSVKVASRLYEDGKRKLEAKREEEKVKREEELKALMEHKKVQDPKAVEAGAIPSRLYEDGKKKIQAQVAEEEAKIREEEERRGLKAGKKAFQPNLVSSSYYEKKIKKSLEKEDNGGNRGEAQKDLSAVTPKPIAKRRPVSSVKRSVAKKKQDEIKDNEVHNQKGDDNFSSEFFERLQMSEKKKNENLARLKKETDNPKNYHKKGKKESKEKPVHEVDTSNVDLNEVSSSISPTSKGLFGGLFGKKEQTQQQCSVSLSGTASVGNDSKDGAKSLSSSKNTQDEGENFSSEFFERLQAMEEKKKKNLARLQEEKEREMPFQPKNFHKKSKKEKDTEKEGEVTSDAATTAQSEEGSNTNKKGLFGGIFVRKQQLEPSGDQILGAASFESETKDGGKSVSSRNTQDDGKNFSSEFFDRLQTTEEKKKKNLARLQEEKEKEMPFQPKNFHKKSKKEIIKVSKKPTRIPTVSSISTVADKSKKNSDRKSSGSEIGKHTQNDGKNFSSEFFERLQTTEEKKAMKLARLKEEAEKELDFKPKNFHKKKKQSSEGTQKNVDTLSDNMGSVPKTRDIFTPLDEENPVDSERATFCCWKLCSDR